MKLIFSLPKVVDSILQVGARGIEFDWKYIQKSLDSNVSLVHYLTLATLVWLFTRRDALVVPGNSSSGGSKQLEALLLILMAVCSYKVVTIKQFRWFLDIKTLSIQSMFVFGYTTRYQSKKYLQTF